MKGLKYCKIHHVSYKGTACPKCNGSTLLEFGQDDSM